MAATAQQRVPESDATTPAEVVQPYALELIERAQIDMQISTAKKYPRDVSRVKKKMLEFATLDEETAESCFYTLTREGKNIQGPSVRLAEIAVSCYGNLRAASRLIDNDGKTVTSQGVCHDLENNTLISVEVKRRITGKNGRTYSEDMQVVTGNAANSISFRNAVFKVIPGALVKPVYEAAKAVAVGDASTLSTKRTKIISRLNSMQATTDRILHKLGKTSIENIGLEDLEVLIGLGTAIKDGDTTVDEAFPVIAPAAESIQQPQRKSGSETPRHVQDILAARELVPSGDYSRILASNGFERAEDVPATHAEPILRELLDEAKRAAEHAGTPGRKEGA